MAEKWEARGQFLWDAEANQCIGVVEAELIDQIVRDHNDQDALRDLICATYQIVGAIWGANDDETLIPLMDWLSKAQRHEPLDGSAIRALLPYVPKSR